LIKKERKLFLMSLSSSERKDLIIKKMKDRGIEIGSGVKNKSYENDYVIDLIEIANYFPELRDK